jgi:outer membrane beta-barrel protein
MRTHAKLAVALAAFALLALAGPAAHAQAGAPPAPVPTPGNPAADAPPTSTANDEAGDVQAIHVVEKRPFTEGGRGELTLFAPIQVNTKFTTHFGVALEGAYHIRENLAVQVGLIWNPIAQQSTLTEELVNKVNQQPLAADALLMQGGGLVGLELMPVYGKLNIFDGKILKMGFYINVGLGAAKTRLQLQGSDSPEGRTYGDTGIRPMAGLGAGFRVFFTDRFTLRLEIRDLVYSAYVSTVNGCNYADTVAISHNGTSAMVSANCNISAFGSDPKGDAAVAAAQIQTPSADVVNNLTAFTGLSFLF